MLPWVDAIAFSRQAEATGDLDKKSSVGDVSKSHGSGFGSRWVQKLKTVSMGLLWKSFAQWGCKKQDTVGKGVGGQKKHLNFIYLFISNGSAKSMLITSLASLYGILHWSFTV